MTSRMRWVRRIWYSEKGSLTSRTGDLDTDGGARFYKTIDDVMVVFNQDVPRAASELLVSSFSRLRNRR